MVRIFSTLTNILWTQIVSKFVRPRGTVKIGTYTTGNPIIESFDDTTNIVVGRFCSFAPNVTIVAGGGTHPYWTVANYPLKCAFIKDENEKTSSAVVIGNDVWIGTNVTILPRIRIGDGAIIGAGTVVTHDVPPYAIIAGVPGKVLRYRFSQDQIQNLLRIAWWDWSVKKIIENIEYFEDVNKFIEKFAHTSNL